MIYQLTNVHKNIVRFLYTPNRAAVALGQGECFLYNGGRSSNVEALESITLYPFAGNGQIRCLFTGFRDNLFNTLPLAIPWPVGGPDYMAAGFNAVTPTIGLESEMILPNFWQGVMIPLGTPFDDRLSMAFFTGDNTAKAIIELVLKMKGV